MDALISGRAGVALIRRDDSLASVHVGSPRELVPRSVSEWNFLLGQARDLQLIENTTLDEVERTLDKAHKRGTALDLTLILLDSEFSEKVRREAAGELEVLLQEPSCLEGLEFILYATPTPSVADLDGATRYTDAMPTARSLLTELSEHQPSIRGVAAAWRTVTSSLMTEADEDDWQRLQEKVVEAGLFYLLSTGSPGDDQLDVSLAAARRMPGVQDIPVAERVLTEWAALSHARREGDDQRARHALTAAATPDSGDIAIDFGTTTTRVYASGRGIVVSEPSIAAFNAETNTVEAVGNDARALLETPRRLIELRPMIWPGVSDAAIFDKTFQHFVGKALSERWRPSGRVIIGVPGTTTLSGVRAFQAAAYRALASKVHIVDETVAAAVGAGLPMPLTGGQMLIDIGGGTTQIAMISRAGIVYSKALRVAGADFDAAIVEYVRRRYNVLIGARTAEQIKMEIGSAWPLPEAIVVELKGRNLMKGTPSIITITDQEVREALDAPISIVISGVRQALEHLPLDLAGQVAERGIVLAGGGALLRGLAVRLTHDTGVPASIADDPVSSVALGTGRMLDDLDLLHRVEEMSRFSRRSG
jgi:rod shape-determining protein MreB